MTIARYATLFLLAVGCNSSGGDGDAVAAAQPEGETVSSGGAMIVADPAPEAPGEHCTFGGMLLQAGNDDNHDGALQRSEVKSTKYSCAADCGSYTCGGGCGQCAADKACNKGNCVCKPQCDGRSCGDDGCGGSCGSCASLETCDGGKCTPPPACLESGAACGPKVGACCGGTECAGVLEKSCQSCDKPATIAGELCSTAGGSQCCGGSKNNFVGVTINGAASVCLRDGDCGTTCDANSDCVGGRVCIRVQAGSQCCGGEAKGICALLAQ